MAGDRVMADFYSVLLAQYGIRKFKSGINGVYPPTVAGESANLLGQKSGGSDEFTFQETPENGYEMFSVKGNTILWNQLEKVDFSRTINDITFTASNGKLNVSGTASANTYWLGGTDGTSIDFVKDHIYLFSFGNPSYVGSESTFNWYITVAYKLFYQNTEMYKPTSSFSGKLNFTILSGQAINTEFIPQVFDLTHMMGSTVADEIYAMEQNTSGSGVAYFRKLFPLNYYVYNTGSLLSFNGTGVKEVGFNQWDEEWENGIYSSSTGEPIVNPKRIRSKNPIKVFPNTTYYCTAPTSYGAVSVHCYDANDNYISTNSLAINNTFTTPSNCYIIRFNNATNDVTTYNNDICINISSSKNGTYEPYKETICNLPISKYFPNGMRSAGSAYDELSRDKATTRIVSVDLGSLSWNYASQGFMFSSDLANDAVKPSASSAVGNIVCSVLESAPSASIYSGSYGIGIHTNGEIRVRYDNMPTNPTDFQRDMSGVSMFYEIANPAEVPINPPLELSFPTVNGGTEELLPVNGSAPVTSPIKRDVNYLYEFNAVDNIIALCNCIAQEETSPTTHAYSSGDYLMYNYQLYRVTSSISVGGTLTVGTNITATTVMDELLSLTA